MSKTKTFGQFRDETVASALEHATAAEERGDEDSAKLFRCEAKAIADTTDEDELMATLFGFMVMHFRMARAEIDAMKES